MPEFSYMQLVVADMTWAFTGIKTPVWKLREQNGKPTRRALAMNMVSKNEPLWRYPEFAGDKEVVLAAIKNIRYSIQYASSELQKDRDVLNCCFEERPDGFGNVLYLRTLLSRS